MLACIFGKKPPYDKEEILNVGLHLAMAFGQNWLEPIQSRLSKKYPALSSGELDEYNAACKEAMKFGHDTVYSMAETHGKNTNIEEFKPVYTEKYPWVSLKNIKGIFNQGMYYAYKDLGF